MPPDPTPPAIPDERRERRAAAPPRRRVALLGFGDFERDALASYFRLAGARDASGNAFTYRPGRALARCDFIVAVSDHAASVQTVLDAGREGDTVFVGHRRPEGAGAWLARPIEPTRIVRELDGLAGQRQMMITVPSALDESRPRPRRAAATAVDIDLDPTEAPPAAAPARHDDAPAPDADIALDVAPPRAPRRAVVAEAAAGALAVATSRLRERGYAVETATSGEAALTAAGASRCDLAVLDAALGADGTLDGFEVCQCLRGLPPGEAPKVVIVGAGGAETDRVRAMLAGCDAYVAAPLTDDAIDGVLRRLEPATGAAVRPRGRVAQRPSSRR